jgi:hypothetical protein
MADRILNSTPISRRSGNKFLSEDFGSKSIVFKGHVLSPSASGLIGIIDNIQRYLGLTEQSLVIDSGRTYTATMSKANFPEMSYTQSVTPFEVEFVSSLPFSEGSNRYCVFTIPSGLLATTVSTTISGAMFNEPNITLDFIGDAGDSGITQVQLDHTTSGQQVTISGSFDRGNLMTASYSDATVTNSGLYVDYTGSFSRWEAGSNSLIINLEGSNNFGINGLLEYKPRYFQ